MVNKMDKLFEDKKAGAMYVGEVVVSSNELNEAVAAAERILSETAYGEGVTIEGDKKVCDAFGKDVIAVATMLQKLTGAITGGRRMDTGEVN